MLTYIMMGLGWILNLFYEIIGNYGLTIILFTVFIKLVLFPLDLKQRRSMAKTQQIQPLLTEIQKKYANDPNKQNLETRKLYQQYGINPMGGCLPMLIQFPIIIALYWVVRKPIVYMMGVDLDETWRIAEAFSAWATSHMDLLPEALQKVIPLTYEKAMSANTFGMNEIQIAQMMHQYPEILKHPYIANYWENLKTIDFSFCGMNLADTPNLGALGQIFTGNFKSLDMNTVRLWIIPILSGASSFLSSYIIGNSNKPKQDKNVVLSEDEKAQNSPAAGADTMKSMTYIMPLFSAWFAFTLPAAIGLYWTVSNIIQIVQQLLVKKMFSTDVVLEEVKGESKNVKNRKKR